MRCRFCHLHIVLGITLLAIVTMPDVNIMTAVAAFAGGFLIAIGLKDL